MSDPTARDLLERCQTLLTTMELTGEEGDFLNEIDAFLAESETTKGNALSQGAWRCRCGTFNTWATQGSICAGCGTDCETTTCDTCGALWHTREWHLR